LHVQDVFRKTALEQLKTRVQGSLKRANASATADMDRLLEQQAELTRRDREVSAGVDSVQVLWHPPLFPRQSRTNVLILYEDADERHATAKDKTCINGHAEGAEKPAIGPCMGSGSLVLAV
jgi:hypothetical protein